MLESCGMHSVNGSLGFVSISGGRLVILQYFSVEETPVQTVEDGDFFHSCYVIKF